MLLTSSKTRKVCWVSAAFTSAKQGFEYGISSSGALPAVPRVDSRHKWSLSAPITRLGRLPQASDRAFFSHSTYNTSNYTFMFMVLSTDARRSVKAAHSRLYLAVSTALPTHSNREIGALDIPRHGESNDLRSGRRDLVVVVESHFRS